jgi:hypothetical protein
MSIWRRCLAALAFAAGLVAAPAIASAQTSNLWVVRGVPVEATGESPTSACDAAQRQGRDVAFRRLVERIVVPSDWNKVPTPSAEELENLVIGFDIADERRSTTMCKARMSFVFDSGAVKSYLRSHSATFTDKRAARAVILPVLETGSGRLLWEPDNNWRNAWKTEDWESELQPIEAPFGDDGDKAAVVAGMNFTGDWSMYEPIAKKYGVKSVILAIARINGTTVEVEGKQIQAGSYADFRVTGTGATESEAIADAQRKVLRAVLAAWMEQNALDNSKRGTVSAFAPLRSPGEWVQMRERLQRVPNLTDITVTKMTVSGVSVVLSYRGRDDQLIRGLTAANYGIYAREGGGRVLTTLRKGEPMAIGKDTAADAPATETPRETPASGGGGIPVPQPQGN